MTKLQKLQCLIEELSRQILADFGLWYMKLESQL